MLQPGPRCSALLLPGPRCFPAATEPLANTCHPLSVTKSPVAPRWPSCPCPQVATSLSLQPRCLLLYPESCDTARLLATKRPPGYQSAAVTRGDKKRVARSLPPCAPRCPEPARLRFPPCGIRAASSASCRGECGSRKVAKCAWSRPELSGGYSPPLRGVTECPPQPGDFLHRCSKGYPTQELVACSCGEQGHQGVAKVVMECGQLREVAQGSRVVAKCDRECGQLRGVVAKGSREVAKECPQFREVVAKGSREVAKVVKECPQFRGVVAKGSREVAKECGHLREVVAKGSPLLEVAKARELGKSRCGHHRPRGTPRPSRLAPGLAKRSGHPKKIRSASRWLW